MKAQRDAATKMLDELIAAAQAHRDQQWSRALGEIDLPLFGATRLLDVVPATPEEVPAMLRRIEGMIQPPPHHGAPSNDDDSNETKAEGKKRRRKSTATGGSP